MNLQTKGIRRKYSNLRSSNKFRSKRLYKISRLPVSNNLFPGLIHSLETEETVPISLSTKITKVKTTVIIVPMVVGDTTTKIVIIKARLEKAEIKLLTAVTVIR